MITPVQRLPRYLLLLEDMLRHTYRSHPDYDNLEAAVPKMREITEYINNEKKFAENMQKFVQMQRNFTAKSSVTSANNLFDLCSL